MEGSLHAKTSSSRQSFWYNTGLWQMDRRMMTANTVLAWTMNSVYFHYKQPDYMINQTFTVTSEHTHFYFLLFLFYTF